MPCTDGGAPVTIDRLFGFVNDGTTQSAVRHVPRLAQRGEERRAARGDRLVDVFGLAAVDADDDERPLRPAVGAAVDRSADAVMVNAISSTPGRLGARTADASRCMRSRLAIT